MGRLSFYSNVTVKIREKNGVAKTIGKLTARPLTDRVAKDQKNPLFVKK